GRVFSAESQEATRSQAPRDAVEDAQKPQPASTARPEQRKTEHDLAPFSPADAPPSSNAFKDQPDQGQVKGFDFARDPLDAKRPGQTAEEITKADIAARPQVMA